ncbi:hypothetical protein [Xylophilus sp.]|uniref:hypothetical protein n=1 Tax=Xylophilus sp. TaxID=2653893 RepID=UPI002D7E7146|nr:hypothetical protein [Xylophilus sp.]
MSMHEGVFCFAGQQMLASHLQLPPGEYRVHVGAMMPTMTSLQQIMAARGVWPHHSEVSLSMTSTI